MPPRSRRRGYIEQLPSGSYRAVVIAGIDPLTRRRRYIRATAETRPEAEKELTRLQRDVDQDKHPKSAITMAEAVRQWMDVVALEETTRDRYEDLIRLYVLPTFGDLQIGRIDAELLERFYAQLQRCKHLCPVRPPKGHVHQPLSTSTDPKDPLHHPGRPGTRRPLGLCRRQRRRDGLRTDARKDATGPA